MLNEEQLLAAGYKKCGPHALRSFADCFYQKPFWVNAAGNFTSDRSDKKAFFVNVWSYPPFQAGKNLRPRAYVAEGHLFNENFEWDVEMPFLEKVSLDDMEDFFRRQYILNKCVPDKHNND